jgi:hypothetical protein
MIDFAYPSSSLPVQPEGSNRVCESLSQSTLSGTPGPPRVVRVVDTLHSQAPDSGADRHGGGDTLDMDQRAAEGVGP